MDGVALEVEHLDTLAGNLGHLAGVQEGHGAGPITEDGQSGRQVAAHYALAVAVGHHDTAGMAHAQGAQLVGFTAAHGGYRLGTFQSTSHLPESRREGQPFAQALFDEVGDNLGVGFGGEDVAPLLETALQFQVVFDDTVVDHGNLAVAAGKGVGVGVGGRAVGSPAGVAQSDSAVGVVGLVAPGQAVNLAHRLAQAQLAGPVEDGDTGAVVAPVFEPLEAFQDDGPGRLASDVTYYAAHCFCLFRYSGNRSPLS